MCYKNEDSVIEDKDYDASNSHKPKIGLNDGEEIKSQNHLWKKSTVIVYQQKI